MSWATIRAAVATVVGGVAGISGGAGKVLDYMPRVDRPDDFAAKFKGTTTINAWIVTRETKTDATKGASMFRRLRTYGVLVEGHYAVGADEEATEDAFQSLIDAVEDALGAAPVSVWTMPPESGAVEVRASPITQRKFGETLCHHVQIRFAVDEIAITT